MAKIIITFLLLSQVLIYCECDFFSTPYAHMSQCVEIGFLAHWPFLRAKVEPCCHTGLYALLALRPRPLWQAESKSHSPGRAQDLHEGMSFQPTKLARQSRRMADFFFPAFGPNQFSPASTLKVYENKTLIQTTDGPSPFYLTTIKPHDWRRTRQLPDGLTFFI